MQKATERIGYIDFLKFIGLTGIILAHVGSPNWMMMLRNFDVPLMVILSAILGERSYERYVANNLPVKKYYISRIKRLVIPTWIFLIIYFLLYFLMGGKYLGIRYYIASFCLTRYGIGYVWIILIYLYSAILIPLFEKIKLSWKGAIIVVVAYILYEILYHFGVGTQNKILDTTMYYIIPYSMLTYMGYNYSNMKESIKKAIAIISFLVFAILAVYYWKDSGQFVQVQVAKYPPRLYYLAYGIACSFFAIMFCEKHSLKIYEAKFIKYISMHSMWIYLWHILTLTIYDALKIPEIWYVKFMLVYMAAILMVVAVNMCLDLIEKRYKYDFKYLRG